MIAILLTACGAGQGDSGEVLPDVEVSPQALFAWLDLPECDHGSGDVEYQVGTVEITVRETQGLDHAITVDAERTVWPLDEADWDPIYESTFLAATWADDTHVSLGLGDSVALEVIAVAFCRGGVLLPDEATRTVEVLIDGEPFEIAVSVSHDDRGTQ
jgi:hypothetical protein